MNNFENKDFIKSFSTLPEGEENSETVDITIDDSGDFNKILTDYDNETDSKHRESLLKSLMIAADNIDLQAKAEIEKVTGKSTGNAIEDEEIPEKLDKGIVRKGDHEQAEIFRRLRKEKRFSEAKILIDNTVRASSQSGRRLKLKEELQSEGLNYDEI